MGYVLAQQGTYRRIPLMWKVRFRTRREQVRGQLGYDSACTAASLSTERKEHLRFK